MRQHKNSEKEKAPDIGAAALRIDGAGFARPASIAEYAAQARSGERGSGSTAKTADFTLKSIVFAGDCSTNLPMYVVKHLQDSNPKIAT